HRGARELGEARLRAAAPRGVRPDRARRERRDARAPRARARGPKRPVLGVGRQEPGVRAPAGRPAVPESPDSNPAGLATARPPSHRMTGPSRGDPIMPTKAEPTPQCEFESGDLLVQVDLTLPGHADAISPVVERVMKIVTEMGCAAGREFEI